MNNQDDRLQQKLHALEKGEQLVKVLDELDEDYEALAPLVQLAAVVRSLPHPDLEVSAARAQRHQLMAQGARRAKETGHPAGPAPVWPIDEPGQNNGRLRPQPERRPAQPRIPAWAIAPLAIGALALILIMGISLTGLALWMTAPRAAQAATLMEVSGRVEILNAKGAWQEISNGDQVTAGQRLRSLPASHATLVFFDGSRTTLEPGSDVTLTTLDGDWGNVLRVALTQNAGKTSHSIVPLRGRRSSFQVLTPTGAASVHGTTFQVAVNEQGRSRFAVSTGRVLVSNENSEVFLKAGQATNAHSGQVLESPAYQFTLQGVLASIQGSIWFVDEVPFTVTDETVVTGDASIGTTLLVEGRVLETGEWIADSIEVSPQGEPVSSFTGTLEAMGGEIWQVGSWLIWVDSSTGLEDGLEVGQAVRVTFTLLEDGRWLAQRIEALEETSTEPTPTPTVTPDPEAQPVLSFLPEALSESACEAGQLDLSATLANVALDPEDYAAQVELIYQIASGAEYVDWVELDPSAWERIEAGEQVPFALKVALKDEWNQAAPGSQVEVRVFVLNEANQTAGHDARLTLTISQDCPATATPESTGTPTPTITNTPVITDTATATPVITDTVTATPVLTETLTATPTVTETVSTPVPGTTTCTGAQPHPAGQALADRYGVTYEEIMAWFCQGFGFGEIDLAYSLSLQSGVPVADIFAMKTSGLGWGEIKKLLGGNPGNNRQDPPGQGNPPGKGNPPGHGRPGSTPAPENPAYPHPDGPGNSENAPGNSKKPDKDRSKKP